MLRTVLLGQMLGLKYGSFPNFSYHLLYMVCTHIAPIRRGAMVLSTFWTNLVGLAAAHPRGRPRLASGGAALAAACWGWSVAWAGRCLSALLRLNHPTLRRGRWWTRCERQSVVVVGWVARIVTHGKGRGWAGGWWFHVRLLGPAREAHSTTRTLSRRYQLRYGRGYLGRTIQPLVVVVRSEGLCQGHANQW